VLTIEDGVIHVGTDLCACDRSSVAWLLIGSPLFREDFSAWTLGDGRGQGDEMTGSLEVQGWRAA
jgi:hypothetical protein